MCRENLRGEGGGGVPVVSSSLGLEARVCSAQSLQETTVPTPSVLIYDLEVFHVLISFFFFLAQKYPVVCCWISSAKEMRVLFNQRSAASQKPRMLLRSKQTCAGASHSW